MFMFIPFFRITGEAFLFFIKTPGEDIHFAPVRAHDPQY
jgi:hypothetical protein